MKNAFKKLLFLLLTFNFALVSCTQDDDSTTSSGNQESLTGVFLDSPVQGLYYETETLNGYTNANGQFSYLEGELVTFFVGNIKIGSAIGQEEITPVTIASTTNATIETPEVKNIAAFLQTLDRDGNPANGIELDDVVVDALEIESIDFSKSITQIIGEVVNQVNQKTGITLNAVYPEEAATHLATSLNTTYEPTDILFIDFLPTIESWNSYARPYLPKTASIWIHNTDDEGKPTQSIQYEKHPYRISRTYTYSNYNASDLPENMEIQYYSFGEETGTSIINLTYNSQGQVSSWTKDNSPLWRMDLEKNESGLISAASNFFNDVFDYKDVYTYNEDGNLVNEVRYTDQSENTESMILNYFFTYTEFGEIETWYMPDVNEEFSAFLWEYTYNDENILIERYRESVDRLGRDRTDTYFYDDEERVERLLIVVGDYVSDYIEFYPNGNPKRAETTYQGFLYEIVTWDEGGYSEWKIIDQDTGDYRIEYKDPERNILKIEYYSADGTLLSTE